MTKGPGRVPAGSLLRRLVAERLLHQLQKLLYQSSGVALRTQQCVPVCLRRVMQEVSIGNGTRTLKSLHSIRASKMPLQLLKALLDRAGMLARPKTVLELVN